MSLFAPYLAVPASSLFSFSPGPVFAGIFAAEEAYGGDEDDDDFADLEGGLGGGGDDPVLAAILATGDGGGGVTMPAVSAASQAVSTAVKKKAKAKKYSCSSGRAKVKKALAEMWSQTIFSDARSRAEDKANLYKSEMRAHKCSDIPVW